ncbi:MAG TPA: NnrS family protein, partial [Methyloceanibacter sp.]|nr:NnrS family protein [Methyloceanibacter sp.]
LLQLAEGYGALAWHAHEMLFGYASAVVAGFLLTAVPNWTGRLPVSGPRLMLLFLLWCAGRVAFLATGGVGPLPAVVIDSLFLPCLLFTMGREIVAGRNWRNLKPLVLVGLLAAANIGFHAEVLLTGAPNVASRVGIAALVGLIMLIGGRIVPSFTHSFLSRTTRSPQLPASFGLADTSALLVSAAALLTWIAAPVSMVTGILFAAAAIVQAWRLWRWKGAHTWRQPLVLILHLGYAFVPIGFLLGAISILQPGTLAGTAALHAWTVGAVGTMTLAVMTRATRGHTGHDLNASKLTVVIYATIVAAALLRIGAGFFPESYLVLIEIAGAAWIAAFILFLVEYAPMLLTPRIEHGTG